MRDKMRPLLKSLAIIISKEEGQSLAEYILILFFIALVAVAALTLLGQNVLALFDNFVTAVFGA